METKQYKKGDIIKTWRVDNGKVLATVEIQGLWVSNPTIAMIEADGWVEYTPPIPERTLEQAINEKIAQITSYDNSTSVNEFYLNEVGMWYDYTGRCKINDRVARDKAKGLATTKLGDDGYSIELPIATAETLMGQLEDYATSCYDNTNTHKYNVRQLTAIADVDAYVYTGGYPNKLHFNINSNGELD